MSAFFFFAFDVVLPSPQGRHSGVASLALRAIHLLPSPRRLTIDTRTTVGANIVRPQRDQSLRKKRPHTRLTITREHTVLPYGITSTDEFTFGGVRAPRPAVQV